MGFFLYFAAMPRPGIAFVMDYQNVHHIGRGKFRKPYSLESTALNPVWLATEVAKRRRLALMRLGPSRLVDGLAATLDDEVKIVHVHRGVPNESRDPKGHRINRKQEAIWSATGVAEVHLRPLQYSSRARCQHDHTKVERATEKGVDTAVATQLIELAITEPCRVIILMSQDSDLTPAVEFAQRIVADRGIFIEAAGWEQGLRHKGVWNTWLGAESFRSARDRIDYERWWENRGQHAGWRRYLSHSAEDLDHLLH